MSSDIDLTLISENFRSASGGGSCLEAYDHIYRGEYSVNSMSTRCLDLNSLLIVRMINSILCFAFCAQDLSPTPSQSLHGMYFYSHRF